MKLDPDITRAVHRINDRFLRLGKPTPMHEVRSRLGPKRYALDDLIQELVLQRFGQNYLPRLGAIVEFEQEDMRKMCLKCTTIVLNALQELYKREGEKSFSKIEVTDLIHRMISPVVEPDEVRIGMLFSTDFSAYVGGWNQDADGGVASIGVNEGILDFEDIQMAWRTETESRRQRKAAHNRALSSHPVPDNPADFDSLLRIYNRGRFDRDLENFLLRANSTSPVGLVMLDVDHFKHVNDTYENHRVGDEVLTTVASLASAACAGKGSCYRYGGDEIAILLSNYSAEEAVVLAERIRLAVEAATSNRFPDT
ncbi:MAG TPA: GGDEF domain-containing protein [Terriglobia bacterium]|nr:GGDEF domain-containing protein [Terriglobia bacterium]